jgi:L-fucose isomerase-like protein
MARKTTLGVLVGTRGFFPARLAQEERLEILRILKEEGFETVCPGTRAADRFGEGFWRRGLLVCVPRREVI